MKKNENRCGKCGHDIIKHAGSLYESNFTLKAGIKYSDGKIDGEKHVINLCYDCGEELFFKLKKESYNIIKTIL